MIVAALPGPSSLNRPGTTTTILVTARAGRQCLGGLGFFGGGGGLCGAGGFGAGRAGTGCRTTGAEAITSPGTVAAPPRKLRAGTPRSAATIAVRHTSAGRSAPYTCE